MNQVNHKVTLLDQFNNAGYLILRDFIAPEDCDHLMARMETLVDDFAKTEQVTTVFSTLTHEHMQDRYFLESADEIYYFFEKDALGTDGLCYSVQESLNKVSHALHEKDPVFKEFCSQDLIRTLMLDLGYADPVIRQSMYIFKQARIGGEVAMHQDSTFLHTAGKPVVGLWIALEDATIDNGCLWAIPGRHKEPLRQKFIRNSDDSLTFATLDVTPYDLDAAIPLEVKKGTVIVLHGLLPHASKSNTSGKSRHAFTLHITDRQDGFPVGNWMRKHDDTTA